MLSKRKITNHTNTDQRNKVILFNIYWTQNYKISIIGSVTSNAVLKRVKEAKRFPIIANKIIRCKNKTAVYLSTICIILVNLLKEKILLDL